jgi:hypothetical protein
MLQFIVTRLLNNSRVFFFAGMVSFFMMVLLEDTIYELIAFVFVASPLLIAITNGKSITIREYFGLMASWRSARYSLLLLLVFLLLTILLAIAAQVGQSVMLIRVLKALLFSGAYAVFSPLLVKVATGNYRRLKGAGKIGFIVSAISVYVLFNYLLDIWHAISPLVMVLTAFIGSFALLLAFCAVTAAAVAPDPPQRWGGQGCR